MARRGGRLSDPVDVLHDYIPARLRSDPAAEGGGWLDWVYYDGLGLDDSFYDLTINRCLRRRSNLLFRPRTSFTELVARAKAFPGLRPAGFVFHVSRCGSTLLWRLLSELPGASALSEPAPLDSAIRARGLDRAQHLAVVRATVAALCQAATPGDDRLFVKLDAWSILDLPLIEAAFPDTPWVFLYREPIEVLASHLRIRGVHTVPSFLPPSLFGIDTEGRVIPAEAYCARVLGAIYAAGLRHHRPGRSILVNYDELPEAAWTRVAEHFGQPIDAAMLETLRELSGLDAKRGGYFTADGEAKRAEVSDAARTAAERWMRPAYDQLEAARRMT